jgi:nucleoside-diphosphate-sugar epimerase
VRKVLITGVGGFTGRYLAPRLAEAGYDVQGTVYGEETGPVVGLSRLHRVDLTNDERVEGLIAEATPDKVVHLAAISFVGHCDVNEIYRTNIVGTRNLLNALATSRVRPSTVLIVSSANVYGNARAGLLDESIPPAPVNDYGVTKAAAELVSGLFSKQLPIIIVRPFNYTGRGQSDRFVIPKIVSHVRRREGDIELGNLDVARDFSDVRAVVETYRRLLETPAAIGRMFNVCSGTATSVRSVIDMVERISGYNLNVRVTPDLVRAGDVKMLWGSPDRIESVIGPLDMPPLEETLRWMIED